jgi:hypothetical protein
MWVGVGNILMSVEENRKPEEGNLHKTKTPLNLKKQNRCPQ